MLPSAGCVRRPDRPGHLPRTGPTSAQQGARRAHQGDAVGRYTEVSAAPGWLLTGTRLTDAETLAATPGFSGRLAKTRDYLAASRHAENQRIQKEEEHRQAELRNAQERRQTAEAYASDLRKRARVLRAVLAGMAIVVLVIASAGHAITLQP